MNPSQPKPKRGLIEALAVIEHEQWMHWSRAVVADVPAATRAKWRGSWVAYAQLPDKLKEADRLWARKVVKLLREHKLVSQTYESTNPR